MNESKVKQTFLWWCFDNKNITPDNLLRSAKEFGYSGVELADASVWPLIEKYGLKNICIKGHNSLTDGLNRYENRKTIEKEIIANLKLAVKWNIPNLICFSGNRNGLDDNLGAEITANNLSYLAKIAEDAGVNLILELLNSKIDHKDYQCDLTNWGVKVCKMVNSQRVKLLYDIYHMQIMEGDIIRTIRENQQYIAHYHTAGNPGRNDINDSQELYYPAIVKEIAATGFSGYIGQEFIPKGDPISALKSAFETCDIR